MASKLQSDAETASIASGCGLHQDHSEDKTVAREIAVLVSWLTWHRSVHNEFQGGRVFGAGVLSRSRHNWLA